MSCTRHSRGTDERVGKPGDPSRPNIIKESSPCSLSKLEIHVTSDKLFLPRTVFSLVNEETGLNSVASEQIHR